METPTETEKNGVRLNKQTAGNLINYLQEFPADAKVTIWDKFSIHDCRICANREHQNETKTVMLMLGDFISKG